MQAAGECVYRSESTFWNPQGAEATATVIKVSKENSDAGPIYTVLNGYESNSEKIVARWVRVFPVVQNGQTWFYFRKYSNGSYSDSYQPTDAQGNLVELDAVAGNASGYFDSIVSLLSSADLPVNPTSQFQNLPDMLKASYISGYIENDIDTKEMGTAALQFFDVNFNQLKQDKTVKVNGYLVAPKLNETATLTTNADLTQAKLAFFDRRSCLHSAAAKW